jgi:hypothetical protein
VPGKAGIVTCVEWGSSTGTLVVITFVVAEAFGGSSKSVNRCLLFVSTISLILSNVTPRILGLASWLASVLGQTPTASILNVPGRLASRIHQSALLNPLLSHHVSRSRKAISIIARQGLHSFDLFLVPFLFLWMKMPYSVH